MENKRCAFKVGHPRRCKCSSMELVRLVAFPSAKTRAITWRSTSRSPGEILVPPGLFSSVDVCLEMGYAPMQ